MVHFTALVASSAAFLSLALAPAAEAAPVAARHPAGDAIAPREFTAGAELVVGASQHWAESSSTKTSKSKKARKSSRRTENKSRSKAGKANRMAGKASSLVATSTSPCSTSGPDARLCAVVGAYVGPWKRRSRPSQASKHIGGPKKAAAAKPFRPAAAPRPKVAKPRPLTALNTALLSAVLPTEISLVGTLDGLLGGLGGVLKRQPGGRHAKAGDRAVVELLAEVEVGPGARPGSREHTRRDSTPPPLPVSGVPGFVQVATPLLSSPLARSIAGLVFTASANASVNASSSFALGTSSTQSTPFLLVPDADQANHTHVVSLRLSLLDPQTLTPRDFCATFSAAGPSALALAACGVSSGVSQAFGYDAGTGELRALYGEDGVAAPMALVQEGGGEKADAEVAAEGTAAAHGHATTSAGETRAVKLYFVPAAAYNQVSSPAPAAASASNSTNTVSKRAEGAPRTEAEVYAAAVAALDAHDAAYAAVLSASMAATATATLAAEEAMLTIAAGMSVGTSLVSNPAVTATTSVPLITATAGAPSSVQARRFARAIQ